MTSRRLVLPVAVAVAAIAVGAASANSTQPPVAHASGGDVTVLLYPSAVNVRLVRTQQMLDKATELNDLGQVDQAALALKSAKSNLHKAWLAEKYLIENSPPPVAGEAGVVVKAKATAKKAKNAKHAKKGKKAKKLKTAHKSGGAVVGASPYADYYATETAVLNLEDTVATTALGMLDTSSGPVLSAASSLLFAALNDRDAAIAYIHSLPVVPPPADDFRARASGGAVVATWDTTMQGAVPQIQDELMLLNDITASVKLSTGRARIVNAAELQATRSMNKINLFWPPIPPED
jgi:hypothetical protein